MDGIPAPVKPPWSRIKVASLNGRSTLSALKSIKPLKIMNPRNLGACCQIYLSNYGGGFVAGDEIYLSVECMPNSKTYIGSQAETKIYKSFDEKTSGQTIVGRLHPHSLTVVCPDALIPYRGSRFVQRHLWQMDSNAVLILSDWFHAGRSALGEDFQFNLFSSEIQIIVNGKKEILDRLKIEPQRKSFFFTGPFSAYRSCLSLYIIGDLHPGLIRAVKTTVDELFQQNSKDISGGRLWMTLNRVNAMSWVFRALSAEKQDITALLDELFKAIEHEEILGFNPLARRY